MHFVFLEVAKRKCSFSEGSVRKVPVQNVEKTAMKKESPRTREHRRSSFWNKISPQIIIYEQNHTTDHHFRTKSHDRSSFSRKTTRQSDHHFSRKITPQHIILQQNRTTEHHFRTKSHHRISFWNKITRQNIIFRAKPHHRTSFWNKIAPRQNIIFEQNRQ